MSSRRDDAGAEAKKRDLLRWSGGVPRVIWPKMQRVDSPYRCCTPPRAGGVLEPKGASRSECTRLLQVERRRASTFTYSETHAAHPRICGSAAQHERHAGVRGRSQRVEAVDWRRVGVERWPHSADMPDTASAQAAEPARRPNGSHAKLRGQGPRA
jgi:hypothetical protein